MKNKSIIKRTLCFAAAMAIALVGGSVFEANAQSGRDPFKTAPYVKKKTSSPAASRSSSSTAKVKKGPAVVGAPSIEARINYYKRVREESARAGKPVPKVTSVLLLDEMDVTGIFKTPRGFAAMVEATPIKLSYTIYPGEKFFDGQLVAVEENRLVFRKVTKWSNGKFVASVQNKALREYSMQQDIQGTAPPVENESRKPESAKAKSEGEATPESGEIVSPFDEMNSQPKEDEAKAESAKKGKKKKTVSKKKRGQ